MYPVAVFNDYSLAKLNTFGIPAHASQLAFISHLGELDWLRGNALLDNNPLVIGGGSNMLLMQDLDRIVLVNNLQGYQIKEETNQHITISWAGGMNWHQVVMQAVANNWGGIENLALIPGTIGAAPIQNIGAYGVELKDVFVSLQAYNLATGEVIELSAADCKFGYRESIFKQELAGQYMISEVTLRLTKQGHHVVHTSYGAIQETLGDNLHPTLAQIAEAVIAIRQSKLPDPAKLGNAGSFFKNPEIEADLFAKLKAKHETLPGWPLPNGLVKVPAGWLIEAAGLKGYRNGACGVHAKQALVLVNYGGASAADIVALAHHVIQTVHDQFGIVLTPEVNWIS